MEITERKRIGDRIRAIRLKRGLFQEHLAEMCGMKQQYLARIENGRISTGVDTLSKIATALNCSIDFIENN